MNQTMFTAVVESPPIMTFWQRVQNNAEIGAKSGSTWVVVVAGILGTLYASMTVAQQAQLVDAFPLLKGAAPYVTLIVAFVLTKLKPSNTVSAATQAMLTELATLRLSAFLRARGSPELPTPPPAPLPVPLPAAVVPAAALPVAPVVPVVVAPSAVTLRSVAEQETALLGLVGDYLAEQRTKIPPQADAGSHQ